MESIVKKDLSIFRGTYKECMGLPTEDMKIYLAWDTQEIYIGNSIGEKVLYGVSKSFFKVIETKFNLLKDEFLVLFDAHNEEIDKEFTERLGNMDLDIQILQSNDRALDARLLKIEEILGIENDIQLLPDSEEIENE